MFAIPIQSNVLKNSYTAVYDSARPDLPPWRLLLRLRTRQWVLLALLDQHRHLGRAAAAMSISQPAATKLLQQLEETFAVPLFTRVARGMSPTPYGEALVRHARWVLTDFGAVCEEVEALRSGLSGALRVGSVPGAVPELLAPTLVAYQKQHERVAVSVVVDTSDVMLRQLARGEVDLMLGRLTEDHSAEASTACRCSASRRWWWCARRIRSSSARRCAARAGRLAVAAAAAGLAAARRASRRRCAKRASSSGCASPRPHRRSRRRRCWNIRTWPP